MNYLVEGLALLVMMACVIGMWRSRYQAASRQAHLLLLFPGQLIVTWSAVAPAAWVWTWWWNIITAVGLLLLLAGLLRLMWFMWLRNGSLDVP